MRYTVQLCTGSFDRSVLEPQEVVRKLEHTLQILDVERVIFGWAPEDGLNRAICSLLEKHGIEKYLWLPVFAEIQNQEDAEPNRNIAGQEQRDVNKFAGDNFEFACQSSAKSIGRAAEVFDELTEGCRVDGVFLDRIRYASAAGSFGNLFGCWCPRCQKIYQEEGADTERLQKLAKDAHIEAFLPEERNGFIYRFADRDVDCLMRAKRKLISRQVRTLEKIFRERGLKVGADTFTPSVADFVGQDLAEIGERMDFIKPMVYLRTDAPAGVPFELRGLGGDIKRRLDALWGGDTEGMTLAVQQMKLLQDKDICAAPGVDVNQVEGVCNSDADYVKRFLKKLQAAGTKRIVLSWDIMHISDEMLAAIAGI